MDDDKHMEKWVKNKLEMETFYKLVWDDVQQILVKTLMFKEINIKTAIKLYVCEMEYIRIKIRINQKQRKREWEREKMESKV